MPTLSALSNTSLYAYYGNAAAADQWNDSGTWNSTYGGVWHLSNGDFTDSTANNNNGSNVGSTNTTGIIEEGRAFNGSSQNITVSLNTWSHVATTFNNSTNTLTIYVNGSEVYSNTSASATPSANATSLYIGRSTLANEYWQGSLDEVRFQDTVESATEILTNYRTQANPGTYTTFSSEEGAPTITSNGGGATASISVAENSTAVTTVAATDPGTPT